MLDVNLTFKRKTKIKQTKAIAMIDRKSSPSEDNNDVDLKESYESKHLFF